MLKAAFTALPLTMLAIAFTVPAAEVAETLVEEHCVRCHGSEIYTRADRRIHSLDGLESQVRRCAANLQLQWFDDEILAVTDHLNEAYYRFEP